MKQIELSKLDSERFGYITARGELSKDISIEAAINCAKELGADVLMLRVPTTNLQGAQQALTIGAILTDTLVYYNYKVSDPVPIVLDDKLTHRLLNSQDAQKVESLAREAFRDYLGHYHADPKLSRQAADETYASWAYRSCLGFPVADAVIGIENDKSDIMGFITLKRDQQLTLIELNAVSPHYQQRGIYAALVGLAINWAVKQGCVKLSVSSQLNNISVQKVWCRLGFEPSKSFYTLHLWI